MPNPPPGQRTDRPAGPPPVTALTNCCVVLVRTQGPINLGMIARLCGNLGVTDLRLVAPECEVNCSEARMFSTHNKELLLSAPIFPSIEAATADCGLVVGTSGDFRDAELGEHIRAEHMPQVLARKPVAKWALVFGNEAQGLNDPELRACSLWIHLDTPGTNISYNLANAVAISLYVVATAGRVPEPQVPEAANRAAIDSLREYWLGTLERFHYFKRTDQDRFRPLFRKFLDRLHLSGHDVQVLRGMLSQFNVVAFNDRFDGKPPRRATDEPDAQP